MKNLWLLFVALFVMAAITVGTSPVNSQNNTNDTTASVANLTNASNSVKDAQNMSAIEGTMNTTK